MRFSIFGSVVDYLITLYWLQRLFSNKLNEIIFMYAELGMAYLFQGIIVQFIWED